MRNREMRAAFDPAYLSQVSRYEVLPHEEHCRLFQEMRDGKEQGDRDRARTAIINANLRLVLSTVSKRLSSGVEADDMVSSGNAGLIWSADKFEWNKGFKFSTYAIHWIRKEIGKAVSAENGLIRITSDAKTKRAKIKEAKQRLEKDLGRRPTDEELSTDTGLKVEEIWIIGALPQDFCSFDDPGDGDKEGLCPADFLAGREHLELEEEVERADMVGRLEVIFNETLNDEERWIIGAYYGLDGERCSNREIGERLGISREAVRRRRLAAENKLRSHSGMEALRDYAAA